MPEAPDHAPYAVEPLDEANRTLLESVHPPAWTNPEPPAGRYHLVVVGAGTAGLVTAAGAAGLGARVALIERHLMGGDCLNVGCVPSKAVIRAARSWTDARRSHPAFGGPRVLGDETADFAAAMARMRQIRARFAPHDGAKRFTELGVDVYLGSGRFTGPGEIEVGGKRLRFRRAAIATGGRATSPDVPGLAEAGFRTNETIFNLTERPRRLVVLGGGPIGCELAQAFARFGTQVTQVVPEPQILRREDADAAGLVERAMAADGVLLLFRARAVAVEKRGGRTVVRIECEDGKGGKEEREIETDEILAATGRKPNVEGLGLEAAGVRCGPAGVEVNDRLRTSNRAIFACGDVTSRHQFTHVADAQARIVIQNALFFGRSKSSALTIPWCTYTSPEVAHVGMTEKDAREAGVEIRTLTVPLSSVDRAILDGADDGLLRLHVEKGKDRILGATLVAEHAGDMIGELCLAVTHKIGLKKIGSTILPYPTQGEVLKKAADAWRKGALTPTVKKIFAGWFRLFR